MAIEEYINDKSHSITHIWGDKTFDWEGLYDAEHIIYTACKKAHICAEVKEKYGALRFYPIQCFNGTLKSWLRPSVKWNFSINKRWETRSKYNDETKRIEYKKNYGSVLFNKIVIAPINYILEKVSDLDRFIAKNVIPKSFIQKVQDWQWEVINDAFQTACKRHPHLVNEICAEVDCYKIIKPNEIGIVDGEVIHNKYWKSVGKN